MNAAEAARIVEVARAKAPREQTVFPDEAGYRVLVAFCPHFSVKEWRSMHHHTRWQWLAGGTYPNITLEQAEQLVETDAALSSDDQLDRIQHAWDKALAEAAEAKRLEIERRHAAIGIKRDERRARAQALKEIIELFPPEPIRRVRRRTYRSNTAL